MATMKRPITRSAIRSQVQLVILSEVKNPDSALPVLAESGFFASLRITFGALLRMTWLVWLVVSTDPIVSMARSDGFIIEARNSCALSRYLTNQNLGELPCI